jgi:predicted acyltransferase
MAANITDSPRLASLDQYRGYTVLGMFFVNFAGSFAAIPLIFKHPNTYCTYHDTIMPQFFFAVGFAYRLTLLRRLKSGGRLAAYLHVLRRNLILILLGFIVYRLDGQLKSSWAALQTVTAEEFGVRVFKREFFQTLVHIAVTSLWVLPVIAAGPVVRVAFAAASGLLHLLLSAWFNYTWVNTPPVGIDGGPLGFLTWTIPLLAGSVAYDIVVSPRSPTARTTLLLAWGAIIMAIGYALSCIVSPPALRADPPTEVGFRLAPPPFVAPAAAANGEPIESPNLWTMSQRAGSLSYLTFAVGFALALYAVFYQLCDVHGLRLGIFGTLGGNALAGYLLHDPVGEAFKPYAPNDSPLWYVLIIIALYLSVCYLCMRYLEKHKLFLRL